MVWQQVTMELPFEISIGTVHNTCRRFESTGCVDAYKACRTNTRVLSQHKLLIIGLLMEKPSLYLGEIYVAEFSVLLVLQSLLQPFVETYIDMG